jgi:hypothetical protein
MTAALASYVDTLELPAEPGVSARAVRAVLRMMARIADSAGQFRYGLRGSKLATLTEYSLSVVRRAQRYLVEHGFVERVQVGGGRASTRWRILIHRLRPNVGSRHGTQDSKTQQPSSPDTGQEHHQILFQEMHQVSVGERSTAPSSLSPSTSPTTCEHGDRSGQLASGLPRCPLCRRNTLRQ